MNIACRTELVIYEATCGFSVIAELIVNNYDSANDNANDDDDDDDADDVYVPITSPPSNLAMRHSAMVS